MQKSIIKLLLFILKKDFPIRSINLSCKKIGSNRILFVYSQEYGLVKLSGQKLAGRSQAFVENIFWIREQKSSDIYTIQKSEFQRSFQSISLDYERILLALKYCFYLQKSSHYKDEKSDRIYKLLFKSLQKLDSLGTNDSPPDLKEFYCFYELEFFLELIDLIGYQIDFQACPQKRNQLCDLERNFNYAWLDFQEGRILCNSCNQEQEKQVRILPKVFLHLKELKHKRVLNTKEIIEGHKINQFLLTTIHAYLSFQTGIKFDRSYQEY